MTALVRGVALGVTPCGPEDETYEVGDRVWYAHTVDPYEVEATVLEVFDDCIEIETDVDRRYGTDRTYLVFANELRPIDPAPRRTT